MSKILGVDLGTNSIGLTIRDTEKGKKLTDQIDYFSSIIFKSGIGRGKTGEFSYSAERTKHRSIRNLYKSRKYRLWNTLEVLINYNFCPLSKNDLYKWQTYDKTKGLKRQYPIDATEFEQWIRLDFNKDGVPDYSSPYQIRAELMQKQFDFTNQIDRYKLGRALYHIAQHRGFKSNKGETIAEQEKTEINDTEIDLSSEFKKSEEKKSKDLKEYMEKYNLKTVGCAYAKLENEGIRVRNSIYQAVRCQYIEEIKEIFNFQNELDTNNNFYKRIISNKKNEGTIFYKKPLRSQKGLVGKCTLESNKYRCPISHPEFEKYRAWCLINNIKYRKTAEKEWSSLTLEQKEKLFEKEFLQVRSSFSFDKIRNWIEKEIKEDGQKCELKYTKDLAARTINYSDKTNISGCPISGQLKNLLGENWQTIRLTSSKERTNKKIGESHKITYDAETIWHICFSFEDEEFVSEFAQGLFFDEKRTKQLVRLWSSITQGYSTLSLKAIMKINRFLQKGYIYTDATLLAKLPELFGEEQWERQERTIIKQLNNITKENRKNKQLIHIVNDLISNYKALSLTERFAEHNKDYELDENDLKDVEKYTIANIGEETWNKKPEEEKILITKNVASLYEGFFRSSQRCYYKSPKIQDELKKYLSENFDFLHCKNNFKNPKDKNMPCNCNICRKLNKIYHPSMIEFYRPANRIEIEHDGKILSLKLLESPALGSIKNPMAMRVLHILRKQINELLIEGSIDEDTRIVVETARELNDANMRWAIESYQKKREAENQCFRNIINEYIPNRDITEDDLNKIRLFLEQHELLDNKEESSLSTTIKKDIKKYKLWLEQGCKCIYTGKIINLSSLFNEQKFDFEHTIPKSQSFDSSMANLTICDSFYNRTIKRNQIPTQLANYEQDTNEYSAILPRLQPWIKKVEHLKDNVKFWKTQTKHAQSKDRKDYCIRQRHLLEMEFYYWQNKVNRFTTKEVTNGFRNSQLNDTRIVTKYAYHYLKSVFNNVDVQKGNVTADFRKMLGIQSIDEKKNREKHSHHAIDAAVLTLIPPAGERDKMLKILYIKEEEKKLNGKTNLFYALENELKREQISCGIGNDASKISEYIENRIIVNHISRDNTLTPAKKKARRRGKEIFVKDKNGNLINKWMKGDCIRGQLHGESFYGAITLTEKTENGSLQRDENGKLILNNNISYVIRKELKYKKSDIDSGFKTWDELEKSIVNKTLIKMMKSQFEEGVSFKDACEQGIFMLNKQGENINRIRHIRCFTSIKNPLKIKKHTYLSSKPYRQYYYAEMGDLYSMCKYENKSEKEYKIWSLFDICNNRKLGLEDIPTCILSKNNNNLFLSQSLKVGDSILIYKTNKEELFDLDEESLPNRLYVIKGFESDGNRIVLKKTINAQQDKILGKGQSIRNYDNMPEKIRCCINTIKYLIKDIDFQLKNGQILFNK